MSEYIRSCFLYILGYAADPTADGSGSTAELVGKIDDSNKELGRSEKLNIQRS